MNEDFYTVDQIFDPSSPFFSGAVQLDPPASAQNSFTDGVGPQQLNAGELQGNTTVTDGYLQSSNYVPSVSGWRLTPTSGDINFNINVQQITLGTSGYIRGGQTDYNTGVGFFLGYSGAAYKFSIGDPSGDYLTWDGTTLRSNTFVFSSIGTFGGDGSDGALSVSSGTTTIDLGSAAYVVKNYTSISITGTGKVAFSNPHSGGTIIILKSQGAVTLTSNQTPMLDASGIGAAGGANATFTGVGASVQDGGAGTDGNVTSLVFSKTNAGAKGVGNSTTATTGGATPTFALNAANYYANTYQFTPYRDLWVGAGGGGGGAQAFNTGSSQSYTTGAGGRGGGCLIIECGGAFNFTTAAGISVAGQNGSDATISGTQLTAAGGAGGGGGLCYILYNTLTANSGTITKTGGTGGVSHKASTPVATTGAGGASAINAGNNGASAVDGVAGPSGGDGASLVVQNTFFA